MPSRNVLAAAICIMVFCLGARPANPSNSWKLVWDEEFNYEGLPDSSKWSYDTGGDGWGNHELEYYTKAKPENARVKNGILTIEARKEKQGINNYTSARLVTKGKAEWKYARIVVSAKLPDGTGTWPAIWMLSSVEPYTWPDDGEIDIMEHVGFDPGKIHASVHCKDYNHVIGTQKTAITDVPGFASGFHEYALQWSADSISMFVDEKRYFSFLNEHTGHGVWPFDQPMHLILNVAVGGDWGGQHGIDESIFPKQMQINYIRVYQQK